MASWAASVALPPLPKANSRPPAANRAAACRAHASIRAPSRAPTARRSSPISAALATVEARTWSSTAVRSPVSEYRNGYSDSRSSLMLPAAPMVPATTAIASRACTRIVSPTPASPGPR